LKPATIGTIPAFFRAPQAASSWLQVAGGLFGFSPAFLKSALL
jgi:hypothetical protein